MRRSARTPRRSTPAVARRSRRSTRARRPGRPPQRPYRPAPRSRPSTRGRPGGTGGESHTGRMVRMRRAPRVATRPVPRSVRRPGPESHAWQGEPRPRDRSRRSRPSRRRRGPYRCSCECRDGPQQLDAVSLRDREDIGHARRAPGDSAAIATTARVNPSMTRQGSGRRTRPRPRRTRCGSCAPYLRPADDVCRLQPWRLDRPSVRSCRRPVRRSTPGRSRRARGGASPAAPRPEGSGVSTANRSPPVSGSGGEHGDLVGAERRVRCGRTIDR